MKLASGIISLLFGFAVLFQSLLVGVGGTIVGETSASQGGSVGALVALLLMIGGAFAFQVPKVAMVFTGLSGLLGLAAGSTTVFKDMTVWGVVGVILTVINYFNSRKPKRVQQPP
ncbi:MAG: hypothetical protein VB144_02065 [Clostridia bacterium]|nr:hypothetical protein [Clostridia bacterium]